MTEVEPMRHSGRETGFPSIGSAGPLSMAQTERRPEEATSGSFFSFAQVHWDKSGTCLSLPAKDSGRTKSFPRLEPGVWAKCIRPAIRALAGSSP